MSLIAAFPASSYRTPGSPKRFVSRRVDAIERRADASAQSRRRETERDRSPVDIVASQVRKGVRMSRLVSDRLMLALAMGSIIALTAARTAMADGDIPIEGTFTQNEPCRGDGSQQKFQLVKITSKDVSYSGGVCSIDGKQQDGNNLAMRVTCKFKSGAVLASAVTFTRKDSNTFDMAQQDGTYRAVLYRCSE
jgi:hypothetical protein